MCKIVDPATPQIIGIDLDEGLANLTVPIESLTFEPSSGECGDIDYDFSSVTKAAFSSNAAALSITDSDPNGIFFNLHGYATDFPVGTKTVTLDIKRVPDGQVPRLDGQVLRTGDITLEIVACKTE